MALNILVIAIGSSNLLAIDIFSETITKYVQGIQKLNNHAGSNNGH